MVKSLIRVLLFVYLFPNIAFATCDWSQIKANADGTFTYSKALHLCVGGLVKDDAAKDQQIADLTKAVQLKDLALTTSDTRANMWMNNSLKLESEMTEIDKLKKENDFLYFGLGVVAAIGVGFATAKLVGK